MSVTVGFSPGNTNLLTAPAATLKPDAATDPGSPASGDATLFGALLTMLTPGLAVAPPEPVDDEPVALPVAAPPAPPPAAPDADMPDPAALTTTEQGKALFKDFAVAIKAAKSALDEGKPLDPALEKKLAETVDAIASWFAGQSLTPQPTTPAALLTGSADNRVPDTLPGQPAAPGPIANPEDATDMPPSGAANDSNVAPDIADAPKVMQAKIVPEAVAKVAATLTELAARLEQTSPALAKAIAQLANRISVGDIADTALEALGLNRAANSTSPELDQLIATLEMPKPAGKPTPAAQAPFTPPELDLPAPLGSREQPATKPEPATSRPRADRTEPVTAKLDLSVSIEAKPAKPEQKAIASPPAAKPVEVAQAVAPTPDVAPQAVPVATAATATRAIHAAYAAPVHQLNVPQMAFEMARQIEAGNTRFQLRLDPPELGRIDVRLDLDKHGTISARMVVERPETLDLMQRDQRALQQALQQAGLDMGKTSLEFSLRQNPFAGTSHGNGQDQQGGQPGFGPFGQSINDEAPELVPQTLYRGEASASGVNLFV